ncbi:MAG: hypothetical protein SNG10_07370 [Rikenellaceae bacterium]
MKRILKISLVAAALMFSFSLSAQQLLVGGSGWNKIAIIEKETKEVLWQHPLEKGWECNNAVALKGGNILYSYKKGAQVITADHEVVWDIKAPEGCEMQSAKLLSNGNSLIAWCGHPLTIMEVDSKSGEILKKVEYETEIQNPHAQMRQINKMDNGNYIVPLVSQKFVHIVSPEGKLVKKIEIPVTPFATDQIKGSVYLVAGGDTHGFCEVDFESGEVLRTVNDGDIKDTPMFFIGGVESNKKSFYVCSWQGHSKGKTGPKVLELDSDLNMLWYIDPSDEGIGRISSVCSIKYKKKK